MAARLELHHPSPARRDGKYQPGTGTVTFNLPAAPAGDAKASVYLACAGDESGGIIVSVNGINLGTTPGVTSAPNPVTEAGFDPSLNAGVAADSYPVDNTPTVADRHLRGGLVLQSGLQGQRDRKDV